MTLVKTIGNNPTSLTDADATRLGLKAYFIGTTYNSVALTVSSNASAAPTVGRLIPYQVQDGSWRLKGTIVGRAITGASDITDTIAGVTFGGLGGGEQAVTAHTSGSSLTGNTRAQDNSGGLRFQAGGTTNFLGWQFDCALASKPTWAF